MTKGEDMSARARARSPCDLEVMSGLVTYSGLELSKLRGSVGARVQCRSCEEREVEEGERLREEVEWRGEG